MVVLVSLFLTMYNQTSRNANWLYTWMIPNDTLLGVAREDEAHRGGNRKAISYTQLYRQSTVIPKVQLLPISSHTCNIHVLITFVHFDVLLLFCRWSIEYRPFWDVGKCGVGERGFDEAYMSVAPEAGTQEGDKGRNISQYLSICGM